MDHLTEQDAGLLEQAASMLEGLANDERNRGNCSSSEGAACSAHAIRRLAPALLRAGRGCLAQIEEPAGAAPAAVAPHITEPYTLAEIKAKIASHDYNAEHLLQHAMLLLEPAAVAPFGYVNTYTGQFFFDVDACRKNNEGNWRTVYLQPATAAEPADADLRKALQFYANGEHFILSERDTSWDTVSGEPQNFWCDEAGTATVEDGSIAKLALAGQPIEFEEDDAAPALEAPAAPIQHQGMTIAGNGAAELGKLMREQRDSRLGVYPDGNPNSGQP